MLRVEPFPVGADLADGFAIRCQSEEDLDSIWSALEALLERWAQDGFDGKFEDVVESPEGDIVAAAAESGGFATTCVTIQRRGAIAGVRVDLGTSAAGGLLAFAERLRRLLDGRGVDAVLCVGDPFGEPVAALPTSSHVELTAEDLDRLRAAGGSRVEVEVLGRLCTGIQSFELHAASLGMTSAMSWVATVLDRWYEMHVVPQLGFLPERRQMRELQIGEVMHVDVTLQRDPVAQLSELAAMLAELPADVAHVRLRLFEAAMLMTHFN